MANVPQQRQRRQCVTRKKNDMPSTIHYALMGLNLFTISYADTKLHRLWVYSQTMFNQLQKKLIEPQMFERLRTRVLHVERNMTQGRSSLSISVETPLAIIAHLCKQDVYEKLVEMQQQDGRLGQLVNKLYDTIDGKLQPKIVLTIVDYMMICLICQEKSPHVSVYEDIRVDVMDRKGVTRMATLSLRQLIPKPVEYGVHEMMKPYYDVMVALYGPRLYEFKDANGNVVYRENPITILETEFKTFPLNEYEQHRIRVQLAEQHQTVSRLVRSQRRDFPIVRRPRQPRMNTMLKKRTFPVMCYSSSVPPPPLPSLSRPMTPPPVFPSSPLPNSPRPESPPPSSHVDMFGLLSSSREDDGSFAMQQSLKRRRCVPVIPPLPILSATSSSWQIPPPVPPPTPACPPTPVSPPTPMSVHVENVLNQCFDIINS